MSLRIQRNGLIAGSGASVSLLSEYPSGAVWATDATVVGVADEDSNVVLTSLTDRAGSTHLAGPATASKRPRGILKDYIVNGRKSVLLDNDSTNGSLQYLEDPTADNSIWKPIVEIEHSTGATLVLSGVMRGSGNASMLIGNYAGSLATPGFYVTLNTTGAVSFAVWKSGTILINATTAVSSFLPHERFTIVIRVRPDRTWSVRVNGVERLAATTSVLAEAGVTFVNRVTMGANSGSGGATNTFGGNLYNTALYHSALSTAECEAIESANNVYYAVPAPSFDVAPLADVSVLTEANIAILGTSIEMGSAAETTSGWGGHIIQNLAPAQPDLALSSVGGYRYPTGIIDTMAVGSLTARGRLTPEVQLGFDTVAADHVNRMDHQLDRMNTAGVFTSDRELIVVCPVVWINDVKNGFGRSLDRDRLGDTLRMLSRLVTGVRAYKADQRFRFVLLTCTPIPNVVNTREMVIHNKAIRPTATALTALTGCPVVVADTYTPLLNGDLAVTLADALHPTADAHNNLLAPVIYNAIRYVSGLPSA